jgi:hypothetical protein
LKVTKNNKTRTTNELSDTNTNGSLNVQNPFTNIFFSYNVGSLDNFKGAIVHYSLKQIIFNIRSLYSNSFFLKKLETEALKDYTANYSEENIKNSFKKIQNIIL